MLSSTQASIISCLLNLSAKVFSSNDPSLHESTQPKITARKKRSKVSAKAATAALEARIGYKFADATLLIVFNSHHEQADFMLPPCNGARAWRLLVDTLLDGVIGVREFRVGEHYDISGRSLLVFELLPDGT